MHPGKVLYSTLIAMALILFAYFFLDLPIARFFSGMLQRGDSLAGEFSLLISLPPIVLVVTSLSWMAWLLCSHRKEHTASRRFFQFLGCTLPLSFAGKFVLKRLFARPRPELCLADSDFCHFIWLAKGHLIDSFPSGHMTVLTAATLAMWRFYPRYRFLYVIFLLALATSLVVFDFHFLSDVIAGFYLGLLIDLLVYRLFQGRLPPDRRT